MSRSARKPTSFAQGRGISKALMNHALELYQPVGLFNQDDFDDDYNRVLNLCKMMKAAHVNPNYSINHQMVLNYLVISFNLFGRRCHEILFSAADELIFPDLLAYVAAVGSTPPDQIPLVDGRRLDLAHINMNISLANQLAIGV